MNGIWQPGPADKSNAIARVMVDANGCVSLVIGGVMTFRKAERVQCIETLRKVLGSLRVAMAVPLSISISEEFRRRVGMNDAELAEWCRKGGLGGW